MTKAVVAQKVAHRTGMSRKDTMDAIEIFLESIKDALKQGKKISLVGFGTFYMKEKQPRKGRNPRTGDRISIPSKRVATFKPGKAFREMVNETYLASLRASEGGAESPTADVTTTSE